VRQSTKANWPVTRPAPILCERLDALSPAIVHGFFTRAGGVSDGVFEGLNVGLGSGDCRDHVLENRRRVADWLGAPAEMLAAPHQIHSPDVAVVEEPWPYEQRPRADAVVTNRAGVPLGVLTADCGPVLFADADAGVIGAAHAGWRGALSGVIENTVDAMEKLGARRAGMVATLGPTIGPESYEVGAELVEAVTRDEPDAERHFRPASRAGHFMFDLPAYVVARLAAAGVAARWTGQDTYADEARFYSYRRKTHRGEADYGRQISAIMIRR